MVTITKSYVNFKTVEQAAIKFTKESYDNKYMYN
jgi:hypothetical protein